MLDLLKFQKPQRYIGNELNVAKKSHFAKITFCLCYPDLYEIGMDNLGLRIIYGILNSYSDVVCERVFLPGRDLMDFLGAKKKPLFSLETKTCLNKFQVIGFNFGYELNYLNFLNILEAGNIELLAENRKDTIVIGGGIANPQPLADFVDVFCLGEFEAVANDLVEILRRIPDKAGRLEALSQREGFYVPCFYKFSFTKNAYRAEKIASGAIFPLKRAKVKDLDKSFFPLDWITPHTKLIQDRVPLEIARGCPNYCNFCQARNIYRPYREKSVEAITQTMETVYKNSGYESFSLLSLSASDYSHLDELIKRITPFIQKNKISLSLPSLKLGDPLVLLYEKLLAFQKTPLTFAVEAGTQELRQALNKHIDCDSLFTAADSLYKLGLKLIKVYFMYGFPQEKRKDLLAAGEFIRQMRLNMSFQINVSINLFIPKPYSCWEDKPFCDLDEARKKINILLGNIPKSRTVKVNTSDLEKSLIEAILSRADDGISPVLLRLQQKQKELVENEQIFSWPLWEEAFSAEKIDWRRFISANTENFPWYFIKG